MKQLRSVRDIIYIMMIFFLRFIFEEHSKVKLFVIKIYEDIKLCTTSVSTYGYIVIIHIIHPVTRKNIRRCNGIMT